MTTLFQDHWWLSWNFEFHYKYKYETRSSSDQEWWVRNSETTQGSVAVIGIFWVLGCLSLPGQIQIRAKENYKYDQWKNTNTDHWQIQMRLLDKYKYKQWKNTNTGKKYNQGPLVTTNNSKGEIQIQTMETYLIHTMGKYKYRRWKLQTQAIQWKIWFRAQSKTWPLWKGLKSFSGCHI